MPSNRRMPGGKRRPHGENCLAAVAAAVLAVMAACSALTPSNSALESARSAYTSAEASEEVFLFAGPELEDAGDVLNIARKAWLRRASRGEVDELALAVTQRVAVARQLAAQRATEMRRLGKGLKSKE